VIVPTEQSHNSTAAVVVVNSGTAFSQAPVIDPTTSTVGNRNESSASLRRTLAFDERAICGAACICFGGLATRETAFGEDGVLLCDTDHSAIAD
jgi:hypothetical protein